MSRRSEKRGRKTTITRQKKTSKKERNIPVYLFICTFHEPTGGVGLWMALLLGRTYVGRVMAEAASLVFAFIFSRVSICRDMDGPSVGSASCSRDTDRSQFSFGRPRLYRRRTRGMCESWDVGLRTRDSACEDFLAPRLLFFSFLFFFLFLEENAVGPYTESHKDDADSDDTLLVQGQFCFWHSAFDLLE
jgi:hypothetical protein